MTPWEVQLAGDQVALVPGTGDVQLLAAVESALESVGRHLSVSGSHPASRSGTSGWGEAHDRSRWGSIWTMVVIIRMYGITLKIIKTLHGQ